MGLDAVLESMGGYGTYQMLIYLVICAVCMRGAWHPFASVFISAVMPHHCRLPDNSTDQHMWANYRDGAASQCHMLGNFSNSSSGLEKCEDGWVYDLQITGNTIVSEWDLVCDREYLEPLSTSVFMGGFMTGALFISVIADKIGRRCVMCVCLAGQAVIGFGSAFSSDLTTFICLRFVIGALNQGIALSGYVLVTELFPARYRTRPGIAIQLFWALGMMVLSGLAYWLQNWRHLQMMISLPSLVLAVSYWLIPESLPWLLSNGKTKEAERVLIKMAKVNKKALPSGCMNDLLNETKDSSLQCRQSEKLGTGTTSCRQMDPVLCRETDVSFAKPESVLHDHNEYHENNGDESQQRNHMETTKGFHRTDCDAETSQAETESTFAHVVSKTELLSQKRLNVEAKTYHIFHLFMRPKMAVYTIIICYLWMANSLGYYGISLSTSKLAGDPYLNFFLSGLVEVPAYLVCMFALERFGRRIPLSVFQLIGGFGNICTVFIPPKTESGADLTPLITALAMIGKFGITGSFSTVFLYSSELFPTSIRNGSVGFSSFWDNLGALCAPFVIYSAKTIPQLPPAIFGIMAIIAGLLTLLLPETLNQPLPETIEDVENLDRRIPGTCVCRRQNAQNTSNSSAQTVDDDRT